MKFDVLNRFTGNVKFTAEIDCEQDTPRSLKLGLAVQWAVKTEADLTRADLTCANLTEANLTEANLTEADLTWANLTWADLTRADLTLADLTRADLTCANLTRADLTRANLTEANLTEANLTEADLTWANLTWANLTCANLTEANLTRADLTCANLTRANLTWANLTWADWVPKIKNIHQTVYEAASKPKALEMADWHTCETTHCRAGWVVHLAGNAGRVMEGVYGTGSAAALIYMVSDPSMKRVPNWTDTNENALADMKRLAELEKAA